MAEPRIFAGPVIRRLRRARGLTQSAMAAALDISPSYLNLVEHGQRPLSAALIVRLADRFGFDAAALSAEDGGGAAAMRRRLADPAFADLDIDPREIADWLAVAPGIAAAFARMYDGAARGAGDPADRPLMSDGEAEPVRRVRQEIERWSNHFADLDRQAEALADELRLADADFYGALAERLRVRHRIAIRILPFDVMPDRLRRLDLHARQLQLSELLPPHSRSFQAAVLLAQLEAKAEVDALALGARIEDRAAHRLFRRHLQHYFAAALMMPYDRFLRACEGTGYDFALLERRFGVGFEQLAHRLTTLQRVGARGLPFFMLRIDRAGQVSKRYAGASGSPMVDGAVRCAMWRIHDGFARPGGGLVTDLAALEDGSRWLTFARMIEGAAPMPAGSGSSGGARFVIALGVEERLAAPITARIGTPDASAIGLGCARCLRSDCLQRGSPPLGRTLSVNERERGLAPFDFASGASVSGGISGKV